MDGMGIQQCIPVDGAMGDGTGIRSLLLVRSREPYGHCIGSQIKRRPTSDFMESLQHDINKNMRGILIDWLVEVSLFGFCWVWWHFASEVYPSQKFVTLWVESILHCLYWQCMFCWVQVAEEYKLVPDTLYYTVSYIDRFLSSAAVPRQRLQLLGVSCMLIAAYVSSELYLQVLEIMCMSGFLAIG